MDTRWRHVWISTLLRAWTFLTTRHASVARNLRLAKKTARNLKLHQNNVHDPSCRGPFRCFSFFAEFQHALGLQCYHASKLCSRWMYEPLVQGVWGSFYSLSWRWRQASSPCVESWCLPSSRGQVVRSTWECAQLTLFPATNATTQWISTGLPLWSAFGHGEWRLDGWIRRGTNVLNVELPVPHCLRHLQSRPPATSPVSLGWVSLQRFPHRTSAKRHHHDCRPKLLPCVKELQHEFEYL